MSISGYVEKFVTVVPRIVKLKGNAGQNIEKSVTITPTEKYPFRITDITARKGKNIRFKLDQENSRDRNHYILIVQNIKSSKGRYVDKIYLKTDSPIRPVVEVIVVGIIS